MFLFLKFFIILFVLLAQVTPYTVAMPVVTNGSTDDQQDGEQTATTAKRSTQEEPPLIPSMTLTADSIPFSTTSCHTSQSIETTCKKHRPFSLKKRPTQTYLPPKMDVLPMGHHEAKISTLPIFLFNINTRSLEKTDAGTHRFFHEKRPLKTHMVHLTHPILDAPTPADACIPLSENSALIMQYVDKKIENFFVQKMCCTLTNIEAKMMYEKAQFLKKLEQSYRLGFRSFSPYVNENFFFIKTITLWKIEHSDAEHRLYIIENLFHILTLWSQKNLEQANEQAKKFFHHLSYARCSSTTLQECAATRLSVLTKFLSGDQTVKNLQLNPQALDVSKDATRFVLTRLVDEINSQQIHWQPLPSTNKRENIVGFIFCDTQHIIALSGATIEAVNQTAKQLKDYIISRLKDASHTPL